MKVYAPNKQYNGVSASVSFRDGIGETDNRFLLDWFRTHGYTVEESDKCSSETEIKKIGRKKAGE